MKIKLFAIIAAICLPAVTAYAAPTAVPSSPEPTMLAASPTLAPAPTAEAATPAPIFDGPGTASEINIDLTILKREFVIDDFVKLDLYDMNDKLLSSYTEWIGGITESIHAHFDVPAYKLGTSFKLKVAGGVNYIKYYDTYAGVGGKTLILDTYGYSDENGDYVNGTDFSMECEPRYEKGVNIYMPDGIYELNERARIIDGVAMVPVRQVAEKIGLKVKYDGTYNSIVCSAGDDEILFNIGDTYTTACGYDFYAPHEPCYINKTVFVPVRTLAEAACASIDALDFGDHLDIVIGESKIVKNYRNRIPVNRWGIGSDTDYLVWISKSEFRTRVYTGSQYNWELVKSFPCAIGAPGSETVTGTFKYQYRMPSWDYGTYYVGPCLVFYGNYAMHSTLLYYGGGEYDGRVGVKISHGCVRLHPQDINWIDSYVPRLSTVYITE